MQETYRTVVLFSRRQRKVQRKLTDELTRHNYVRFNQQGGSQAARRRLQGEADEVSSFWVAAIFYGYSEDVRGFDVAKSRQGVGPKPDMEYVVSREYNQNRQGFSNRTIISKQRQSFGCIYNP